MKKFLIAILTFIQFNLTADEFATINFIAYKDFGRSFSIYLNDQLIGAIGRGENLEYKMYSEGRVSVVVIASNVRYMGFIDVKKSRTYYYLISAIEDKVGLTDYTKGKSLFSQNVNTVYAEEDIKNPLLKSKVTNDEGPKQGTCFLISKQGYMLTNYHVINNSKTIQVKGIGNDFSTLYGAEVIAYDIDLDLALIKLKNQNIAFDSIPYKINLESASQGSKSFVLGYPLTTSMGDEIKVTDGIISAKSGYKGSISQYQISASVQPGNSGSPLFDENGNVIGIINAKLQGAEGAGYAIKSQYISTFLKLIDTFQIEKSRTGISGMQLSEKILVLKNYIFIVKTE